MAQPRPFTREDFLAANPKLLRNGRVCNACVWLAAIGGRSWTVKDFSSRPWYVRWFVAPFILHRERRALQPLQGLDGVPQAAFLIDAAAIAIEFVPGETLSKHLERHGGQVGVAYLESLEALLRAVHARGVVHLDTRGASNVIVRPDGTAGLIDFQAGFRTGWLPGCLRRLVEDFDMSGVYKKWAAIAPDTMGPARAAEHARMERLHRFWFFKGYFGLSKHRRR